MNDNNPTVNLPPEQQENVITKICRAVARHIIMMTSYTIIGISIVIGATFVIRIIDFITKLIKLALGGS